MIARRQVLRIIARCAAGACTPCKSQIVSRIFCGNQCRTRAVLEANCIRRFGYRRRKHTTRFRNGNGTIFRTAVFIRYRDRVSIRRQTRYRIAQTVGFADNRNDGSVGVRYRNLIIRCAARDVETCDTVGCARSSFTLFQVTDEVNGIRFVDGHRDNLLASCARRVADCDRVIARRQVHRVRAGRAARARTPSVNYRRGNIHCRQGSRTRRVAVAEYIRRAVEHDRQFTNTRVDGESTGLRTVVSVRDDYLVVARIQSGDLVSARIRCVEAAAFRTVEVNHKRSRAAAEVDFRLAVTFARCGLGTALCTSQSQSIRLGNIDRHRDRTGGVGLVRDRNRVITGG